MNRKQFFFDYAARVGAPDLIAEKAVAVFLHGGVPALQKVAAFRQREFSFPNKILTLSTAEIDFIADALTAWNVESPSAIAAEAAAQAKRRAEMNEARQRGATYAQIGQQFGVTGGRVRQILTKHF